MEITTDISGELVGFIIIMIDTFYVVSLSSVQGSFPGTLVIQKLIRLTPKYLTRAIPAEGRPVFFATKKTAPYRVGTWIFKLDGRVPICAVF